LVVYYALGGPGGSGVYEGANAFDTRTMGAVLSDIRINTHHPDGRILEEWNLIDCWLTSFEKSELSYEADQELTFSLSIDYMTAQYTPYTPAGLAKYTIFKRNLN